VKDKSKSELLADKLNGVNAVPEVKGGQVEAYGFTGCVDDHPAGADRAGYVPFVYHDGAAAFYHPAECVWEAG
jgi:hypothetical protein